VALPLSFSIGIRSIPTPKCISSIFALSLGCSGRLGLLLKTPQPVGIFRNEGRKNLDRYFALQDRVAGTINLAHSTCAQQAQNFVPINVRACGQCHLRRIIPAIGDSN
jgi:hypothetical protein